MSKNIYRVPLALAIAAVLTGPVLAQSVADSAPSLDGSYKGVLVCAQFPEQHEVLRVPLDLMISGKSIRFSRPIENGRSVVGNEMGDGTIDAGGVRLSSSGTSFGAHFEGKYSGAITVDGGTLIGVQSWTMSGVTRTRPCNAAFVKSL